VKKQIFYLVIHILFQKLFQTFFHFLNLIIYVGFANYNKAVLFQKFALQTSSSQKVAFSGLIILDVAMSKNLQKFLQLEMRRFI